MSKIALALSRLSDACKDTTLCCRFQEKCVYVIGILLAFRNISLFPFTVVGGGKERGDYIGGEFLEEGKPSPL